MAKYIDADRLRAEIERLKETHERNLDKPMERGRIGYAHGCVDCCDRILSFIDSLRQEQPEEGLEKKFTFPKFLFARTLDNKTMDISYAPQSMEAVEYVRSDFIEQEQLEADLEKIIEQTYHDGSVADTDDIDHVTYENIARHFYELGLNTRKL